MSEDVRKWLNVVCKIIEVVIECTEPCASGSEAPSALEERED